MRLQSILVVLFFLAMMTLLVRDHILPTWGSDGAIGVSKAMLKDQFVPQDDWMEVSFNGRSIGVLRATTDRLDDGYAAAIQMSLSSGPLRATLRSATRINDQMEMQSVQATAQSFGQELLDLKGVTTRDALLLRIDGPQGVRAVELPLSGPLMVPALGEPLLRGENMEAGERYAIEVYDPITNSTGRMVFELASVEPLAWRGKRYEVRRVEGTMGGVRTRAWVDNEGRILRRQYILMQGASGAEEGTESISLTLEMLDPREALAANPELAQVPEPPAFTEADVRVSPEEAARSAPDGGGASFGLGSLLLRGGKTMFGLGTAETAPPNPASTPQDTVPSEEAP